MHKYYNKNVPLWEALSDVHWTSGFYDISGFLQSPNSLPAIDQELLGDIRGKNILHLQCHMGLESISMSKMGANVTAIDFSKKAISYAKELNERLKTKAVFINDNVYNIKNHGLQNEFDIVYASYGVIPWLYDLDKWAEIIAHCLKPNGKFILVEFHPLVFNINEEGKIVDDYGSTNTPGIYPMDKSYTGDLLDSNYKEYNWNHSLSQILTALNNYLTFIHFKEYDFSCYPCFENMVESSPGKFQMRIFENITFPYMFSTIFACN